MQAADVYRSFANGKHGGDQIAARQRAAGQKRWQEIERHQQAELVIETTTVR